MHTILSALRPFTHSVLGTLLFLLSGTITFFSGKLLIERSHLFTGLELFIGAIVVLGLVLLTFYAYLVLSATEVRRKRNR